MLNKLMKHQNNLKLISNPRRRKIGELLSFVVIIIHFIQIFLAFNATAFELSSTTKEKQVRTSTLIKQDNKTDTTINFANSHRSELKNVLKRSENHYYESNEIKRQRHVYIDRNEEPSDYSFKNKYDQLIAKKRKNNLTNYFIFDDNRNNNNNNNNRNSIDPHTAVTPNPFKTLQNSTVSVKSENKNVLNENFNFDLKNFKEILKQLEIMEKTTSNETHSTFADLGRNFTFEYASTRPSPIQIPFQNTFLYKVITEISIYVTTLICLTGIVGNMLSLKVFFSTKIPRTSSRIYLIALTLVDCIFLVAHFIDDTCKLIVEHFQLDFPINVTDQRVSMCRAFALIRSTCRSASSWIIVAFTLERFLVVSYSNHSSIISRPIFAKRIVYIIIFFSILISMYAPIFSGVFYVQVPSSMIMKKDSKKILQSQLKRLLYSESNLNDASNNFLVTYLQQKYLRKTCDILADYRLIYLYFTFVYTVLIIIIPLVIVSVLNTLLIFRLYKTTDKWTSAKLELHEQEMSYKEVRDKKVQIENLKITWTLIIVSVTFIVLSMPHLIVYFIVNFRLIKNSSIQIIQKVTELLYLFNHSINFFLYVVTRHNFRKVLKEKLKCDCFNLKKYMITLSPNTSLRKNVYSVNTNSNMNTNRCSGQLSSSNDNAFSNSLNLHENPMNEFDHPSSDPMNKSPQQRSYSYENYWETINLNNEPTNVNLPNTKRVLQKKPKTTLKLHALKRKS